MRATQISGLAALAVAFATSGASAQVVTRSISAEPVETIVTQTPDGTVVTRRPVAGSVVQPPAIAAESIDAITTRRAVERAEIARGERVLQTREVAARPAAARRHVVLHRTSKRTARRVPRIALSPRERHVVYQTIVEREVLPRREVIVAPPPPVVAGPAYLAPPPPAYVAPRYAEPPVVAADESMEPVYAVGSVLPENVPLYAMPQNVTFGVPATRPYSYAYLGGRAYLVEPASGTVVADVTE